MHSAVRSGNTPDRIWASPAIVGDAPCMDLSCQSEQHTQSEQARPYDEDKRADRIRATGRSIRYRCRLLPIPWRPRALPLHSAATYIVLHPAFRLRIPSGDCIDRRTGNTRRCVAPSLQAYEDRRPIKLRRLNSKTSRIQQAAHCLR